jgi:hypothetical protein
MKTHVIQLEPHDDLVSVRDKMSWAKTPRILLVWPARRRRTRLSEIDLTLLRRHAVSLGSQVALVARQNGLRRMAQHAEIPVFRTTAEAQREEWPTPPSRRKSEDTEAGRRRLRSHRVTLAALRPTRPAWATSPAARVGFFSLGVLSVLALALLFVPSAEIKLKPVTQTQSLTLPVSASPRAQSVSLSGVVPAHVQTVKASGTDSIPVTGKLQVPYTSAHGTVALTNLTGEAVSVPEGTVLIAGGETPSRFITLGGVEVPASAGGTADVSVRALQAGAAGNLSADVPIAFEGALGLSLAATNPEPFTGGADRQQPAPTEADRTRLYGQLSAELWEQALAQAQASPDMIFADTLAPAQTTAEDYSPATGETGANLSLELAQDFQASYASRADLETLAKAALDASLPRGYEAGSTALVIIPLSEPHTGSDGVTRWQVRVERTIRAAIRPADVIDQVRGRSASRARAALGVLLLERAPDVRLRPAWFPLLPLIPLRISVDTGY